VQLGFAAYTVERYIYVPWKKGVLKSDEQARKLAASMTELTQITYLANASALAKADPKTASLAELFDDAALKVSYVGGSVARNEALGKVVPEANSAIVKAITAAEKLGYAVPKAPGVGVEQREAEFRQ
jgi:hypothetical protein